MDRGDAPIVASCHSTGQIEDDKSDTPLNDITVVDATSLYAGPVVEPQRADCDTNDPSDVTPHALCHPVAYRIIQVDGDRLEDVPNVNDVVFLGVLDVDVARRSCGSAESL